MSLPPTESLSRRPAGCWALSTSGYYEWRDRPPVPRTLADAQLTETIRVIHTASYGTYGAQRVHAELRLGRDLRVSRKRVERLMLIRLAQPHP